MRVFLGGFAMRCTKAPRSYDEKPNPNIKSPAFYRVTEGYNPKGMGKIDNGSDKIMDDILHVILAKLKKISSLTELDQILEILDD